MISPKEKSTWAEPGFWPVFLNSYSDFADNEVPEEWRATLFATAEECSNLTIQLVTKRIGNVWDMVPEHWRQNGFPSNVWLIATVVNDEELERDMPKLMAIPRVRVRGLSIEPQLGELFRLRHWLRVAAAGDKRDQIWGIVGGESDQPGHKARPYVLDHGVRAITDLREFEYPAFFKQAGSYPVDRRGVRHAGITGKGDDPREWPSALQVQEFPHVR